MNGCLVGAKSKHAPGDFFNRADIGMIRHDGRVWHGRHYRFVRVLHKSHAAVFRDSPESSGAVAITTTQHDAHNPMTIGFGGGDKQRIGSRPGVMDFRPLTQSDAIRP